MKPRKSTLSFLLLTTIILQGCIPSITGTTISVPSASEMAPEEFSRQIEKLQAGHQTSQGSINQEDLIATHQALARLYISPRNPKRDTVQAAFELEKVIRMSPKGIERDDAENIFAILNEINGKNVQITELQEKLRKKKTVTGATSKIKELSRENALLKQRQKEILADKKKLETTIEKLKILDLNLEKKRKDFR